MHHGIRFEAGVVAVVWNDPSIRSVTAKLTGTEDVVVAEDRNWEAVMRPCKETGGKVLKIEEEPDPPGVVY